MSPCRHQPDLRSARRSCVTFTTITMLIGVCSLIPACGEPTLEPTLCVFSPKKLDSAEKSQQALDTYKCGSPATGAEPTCEIDLTDEVFYIRHEVPEGVIPPGNLELRIQTPCIDERLEVAHIRGVAFVQQALPPGAACSIAITASIANSELRCTLRASTTACVADLCPAAPGAKADGG